ncbi:MAG: CBS domain-containing protein [Saprospiraceae bacterium]|nr:CBS domain-containing protein [Saprospiraceae bacterium]
MGEQKVSLLSDNTQMQKFVRSLLDDVQALSYMLENNWFDTENMHIGAEQEMCLVEGLNYRPAFIAMEALEKMKDHDWVESELARFNLEINLSPQPFTGSCLSDMEKENRSRLKILQESLDDLDARYILTGVLPTLKKFHLDSDCLTPKRRYKALMEAIDNQLLGSSYDLRIIGIDELLVKHRSPLLEACNTSFQVHLQVRPEDFVNQYNIAQTLAAPVMAIAANSSLVFGRRLWHESRIALFQQSLDTRSTHEHMRERSPRVSFGNDWLKKSILEIYREDIARFRVLLAADIKEDSLSKVQKGEVPHLTSLQVHNSTVYRWNRPCYGISANGKPHLRIENRVLPSGPTVRDEIANAAFWLGLMSAMSSTVDDIRDHITFPDIRDNFTKAAKFGIDSSFNWFKDKKISACELIQKELIPMAREGLKNRQVDQEDIDKYLDVIDERADAHMNGARWSLRAFTKLKEETTIDEALTTVTSSMIKNQRAGLPVHNWDLPSLSDLQSYEPSKLVVSEFMQTDLFTVQKEDVIELVAEMMDWRKIRYTPVEDRAGNLVGLVSSRILLRYYVRRQSAGDRPVCVEDIMIQDPITIGPNVTLIEALNVMRQKRIGCLPVVDDEQLVGVITESDFLRISSRLLERLSAREE